MVDIPIWKFPRRRMDDTQHLQWYTASPAASTAFLDELFPPDAIFRISTKYILD